MWLAARGFSSSGGDKAGPTFASAGVRVGPWEAKPAAVALESTGPDPEPKSLDDV